MNHRQRRDFIENRTFEELAVGDVASFERRLTLQDIELFAVMSGDINPAHVDEEYARDSLFHGQIAHGMWGGALISTLLGTRLPGPGTIYLGQTLRFHAPVMLGDRVQVSVTVREKIAGKNQVIFACECRNQEDALVLDGEARVLAPTEKISRPRAIMPNVHLAEHGRLDELLTDSQYSRLIDTAVVHPVDSASLDAAVKGAAMGLIRPVLVGPEARISEAARSAGLDISDFVISDVPHSHAAAEKAAAMAAEGMVSAIVKGALPADELMPAVMHENAGLRTERVPSQVMAFDVPTYPRPLLIADPQVNTNPGLFTKRDIVMSAVELAHALDINQPRVAMLSASEAIDPKLSSTLDAAALCKMADRGNFSGALIDGPMAFDTAISQATASARGVISTVAGQADILIAPDLESASMMVKQLTHFAGARGAGLLLGLKVPVVMNERDDDLAARIAGVSLMCRYLLADGN